MSYAPRFAVAGVPGAGHTPATVHERGLKHSVSGTQGLRMITVRDELATCPPDHSAVYVITRGVLPVGWEVLRDTLAAGPLEVTGT